MGAVVPLFCTADVVPLYCCYAVLLLPMLHCTAAWNGVIVRVQ